MQITSQLLLTKIEEIVKKTANRIVDDKLLSKDMLQKLKSTIISLQLVQSDNENFMKICQIL